MSQQARPYALINLDRVRNNAQEIRRDTGVPVIAVVKADAYGLGGERIARALAPHVDGFYVFDAAEAIKYGLPGLGRPTLALLGDSNDPADYLRLGIRPAVWTAARAAMLRAARPVLSVDTGQQRFGCPAAQVAEVIEAGRIDEAFTHATSIEHACALAAIMDNQLGGRTAYRLHAAGTALLNDPAARFNAVRPGLALYRGAVRVCAPLLEARDSAGPAGYSGFVVGRHGVIRAGYSNGLRPGPCLVNGRRSRVIEVGMQSAFVEIGPADRAGDEVVLLGDGLTESEVGVAWKASEQEVLVRLTRSGSLDYVGE